MVGSHSCPECAFGLADMSGNAWEWTRSLYRPYPYDRSDGREDLTGNGPRVLRCGSFLSDGGDVRAALRPLYVPDFRSYSLGFRVVVSRF